MVLLYRIPGLTLRRIEHAEPEPWESGAEDDAAADPRPAEGARPAPADGRVFSRTITTPPGAPWDQARAAELEARMNAPLPLDQVVYQRRRLDDWRPRRHGRFAIFYVRSADIARGLDATVVVDGRPMRVRFPAPGESLARARRLAPFVVGGLASILLIGGAITAALALRASASDRLAQLEQLAQTRLGQAERLARLKAQSRLLKDRVPARSTVADYLGDIGWVTAAKAPGAHIDAVYWQNGYMGVAVRGEAAPFSVQARAVARAAKPVRPGVWLWLVAPPGKALPLTAALQSPPTPASTP
jgi:hypothetical protein